MKIKLLLILAASLCFAKADAKVVIKKSVENSLRWDSAYVVCKNDSVTYSYVDDSTGTLASASDYYFKMAEGQEIHENPFTFFPSDSINTLTYNTTGSIDNEKTDTIVAVTCEPRDTAWVVGSVSPVTIQEGRSYQLTDMKGNIVTNGNHTDNGYFYIETPPFGIQEVGILKVYDGNTIREYLLHSGYGFTIKLKTYNRETIKEYIFDEFSYGDELNDTLCLCDSLVIRVMTDYKDITCFELLYDGYVTSVHTDSTVVKFPSIGNYVVELVGTLHSSYNQDFDGGAEDFHEYLNLEVVKCDNAVDNIAADVKNGNFDDDTLVTIYTIDGHEVYEGMYGSAQLEPGVYIITADGVHKKEIIK